MKSYIIMPLALLVVSITLLYVILDNVAVRWQTAVNNAYEYKCSQAGGKVVRPMDYVKDCIDENGKSIKL